MIAPVHNPVVIVVIEETVAQGLLEAAARCGWPLLQLPNAIDAVRAVSGRRPQVVVVQVSLVFDETVELLRLLRSGATKVLLIGAAACHQNNIERAVRGAGVSCYLPSVTNPESVEQAVASLLKTTAPVLSETQRPSTPWRNRHSASLWASWISLFRTMPA